jgi:hypothetical protein
MCLPYGRRTRARRAPHTAFWLVDTTRGTVSAFHRRPSVTDQHRPQGDALG